MAETIWKSHKETGVTGGVCVAVMSREVQPGEFHVMMLGTFEGMTPVGETFVGKSAEREATIFAQAIFVAIDAARLTWEVPAEDCDTDEGRTVQ